MTTNYNELNFNKDEMTLDERFAAITGVQIFDVEAAINNAPDKEAMKQKLLWHIWGGRQIADDEMFNELIEEVEALCGDDESSDNGSSSDEGSSEEDSSKENDNDNNDEGSSNNEPDVELNVDEPDVEPKEEPSTVEVNEQP